MLSGPALLRLVQVLFLGALLASCAAPPKAAPTPPPPPAPKVNLSPQVVQAASAYRYYMARSSAIVPQFADAGTIAGAVQTGAAYAPAQMVRGAIAYAAVVALQDRGFVDAVRV